MLQALSPTRERALLLTLMAAQFTNILDFMIMMPLSAQLMKVFDISTGQFGLLISAYSLSAGVTALVASAILDRYDRRQVLLISYAGLIVATAACAMAPNHLLMLLARCMAGVFGGISSSIVMAIVGDVIPPARRGRAMGVVMLAFSLASVAGVPAGLWIADHFSWRAPFISVAAVSCVVLLFCWLYVPKLVEHIAAKHEDLLQSYRGLLSNSNHLWAFATSFLVMLAGFMTIPYIAPSLVSNAGLSHSQLPYIYLLGGALTLITRPLIGRITDRHPHPLVLNVLMAASLVPIVLVSQSLQLGLAYQLLVAGLFFVFVSGRFIPCSAMVTASCTPQYRGRVMSFNSAVMNLGSGIAAMWAGYIMTSDEAGRLVHYDWVGYISCVITVIGMWVAWRVRPIS
ncbi:MAG TPA: MFS transporter [Cellvibrionaceae bacterium]